MKTISQFHTEIDHSFRVFALMEYHDRNESASVAFNTGIRMARAVTPTQWAKDRITRAIATNATLNPLEVY